MRPPSGNAANDVATGFAAAGCAEGVAEVMVELLRTLSPKWN